MVYRLLEHDDEFLVKLLCGWCDIERNGLFVALVNRRLRAVVHLATRYEQRRRLIELSWPGHDTEDPLPGYVPYYRTVCKLTGCFLTESRMLYVFEHLATPGTDLHRLLWQQGSLDEDRAKGRFDQAVARCYPYDPRQRQALMRQRVLMNVAAYRMTYRSLNAMLEVASLRCIRRCFLEILGGHQGCRFDPNEAHDQCLVRFAGRHGRVDVLNHLLSRDPSKGLSFDFADGLADAFRALLQTCEAVDLGPERTTAVIHNPVTALLSFAAGNDAVSTLEWFQRTAAHRCGWTCPADRVASVSRTLFESPLHWGVGTALMCMMLKHACANRSHGFIRRLYEETILLPARRYEAGDGHSTPFRFQEPMLRFCLWVFVVMSTRPMDDRTLALLVACCHGLNTMWVVFTRMLLLDLKQTLVNTPMFATVLHAEQEMQFGEEFGHWNEPEGLMDLHRLVVLVDLVLPLKLSSLSRQLGWNRGRWRQTEQEIFSCTAPGPVLRLIVSETEESIEQLNFPTGRRNGWLFHSWQSLRARTDGNLSVMMMLRNDIDPERWNAARTLTHHWLRELHNNGDRSMLSDNRFDELELTSCYRWLYSTMMYHRTPRPNSCDSPSRHWLPLDVAAYAVVPTGAFLDGKSNVGNRVTMAHEAAGHIFGLWWEATSDSTVDPLSVSIIGMAPCPVYQWFSRFVETLDHEARRRAESQFGQLVLYTLDRELASVPRYTLCNVALMALAGWAERQGHIPENLITTFLTTLRDREGPEEQSCSSLAHRVLNRPDPHASPASVDPYAYEAADAVEAASHAAGKQRILPGWMRAGRASERAVFDVCNGLRLH